MLNRLFGATVYGFVTVVPSGSRYVAVDLRRRAAGLATSTNRSKNGPVAPSARNHCVAGAVTPALSWPAPNDRPPRSGTSPARR